MKIRQPLLRKLIWENLSKVYVLYQSSAFPILAVLSIFLMYIILTTIAGISRRIIIDPVIIEWNALKKRMIT